MEEVFVSAVIPCLDGGRTVGSCVGKALKSFEVLGVAGEVVVVDNGSTDGTARIATQRGARVIREPVKGYGAALCAGIQAARGRIIVMDDGDDSYDWAAIAPFVHKIQRPVFTAPRR